MRISNVAVGNLPDISIISCLTLMHLCSYHRTIITGYMYLFFNPQFTVQCKWHDGCDVQSSTIALTSSARGPEGRAKWWDEAAPACHFSKLRFIFSSHQKGKSLGALTVQYTCIQCQPRKATPEGPARHSWGAVGRAVWGAQNWVLQGCMEEPL